MTASLERVVVVGASAGGIDALRAVLGGLPKDFKAAVLVVVHLAESTPSVLPRVLQRGSVLPVRSPVSGERLVPGHVYVAPPDRHMLVADGRIALDRGPRENRVRPAVDPLFRSAAEVWGPRVVGVVLSGSLDDGSAGLEAIKRQGGIAVVQLPSDAAFAGMPSAAVARVPVDYVVRADEIGPLLAELMAKPTGEFPDPPPLSPAPHPRLYSCPACGGPMTKAGDEGLAYECRTGHRYAPANLLEDQLDSIERALWLAVRTLEERGDLWRDVSERTRRRGRAPSARQYERLAEEADEAAQNLRAILGELAGGQPTDDDDDTLDGDPV